MIKIILSKNYNLVIVSVLVFLVSFLSPIKVSAAICPTTGPVTSEWQTGNTVIRSVDLPATVGQISLSNYLYEFWVIGSKPDYECDRVLFNFTDLRYVKEITFKAHDKVDTAGFEIYIQGSDGVWKRVWQNLNLNTKDGCGQGGDCYSSYTVAINSTIKTIQFLGKHDQTERVYLDMGSVKGFDCPTNLSHTCSADGSKATFSWNSLPNAVSYQLRVDKNAPSWYEPGIDIADIANNTSRTFGVMPNVKNTYSVQAIANGENYPYGGNMCWQEFTCKNTLPINNPPTCSSLPVSISPAMQYYLPDSEVSITAVGYSDPDNDPLTITNWQTQKGTITYTSADLTNIKLRMPSTSNETFGLSYVVSDGKSTINCNYPLGLKTKIGYKCENQACSVDANGNFPTNADCLANCIGASKYSCTSSGQCVNALTNPGVTPLYDSSNCDNKCVDTTTSEISCTGLNVTGNKNLPGSTLSISAHIRNFPKASDPQTTYQWLSTGTSLNKSGVIPSSIEFDTAPVTYTVPSFSDTVYFKLNNNTFPACTLNINESLPPKSINLRFEPTSKTIDDSVINTDVNLITETADFFSTYNLQLSCMDITSGLPGTPCPAGSFKFTNPADISKPREMLLSSFTGTNSSNLSLIFSGERTLEITAVGNTIPQDSNYTKTAKVTINVIQPKTLTILVKESTDFKENNNDYCDNTVLPDFKKITLTLKNEPAGVPQVFNLESQTPPSQILNGNYVISFNLNSGVVSKEIKCMNINGDTKPVSSRFFNVASNNVTIKVVVGPTWGNAWYQGFGGSSYSFGGFSSTIGDTTAKIIDSLTNIMAGVLHSSSLIVGDGKGPDKYVIYPSSYLDSTDIKDLDKTLADSSITKIDNLSLVAKDSDKTPFYYFSNSVNRLTISSDFKVNSGKKSPVVFIKGDVIINNSVKQLDMIIISTGSITLGNDPLSLMDLTVNGALLSKSTINFDSKKLVPDVNGKLTEKFYFDPSIYFSDSPNSFYFKAMNIFANLID